MNEFCKNLLLNANSTSYVNLLNTVPRIIEGYVKSEFIDILMATADSLYAASSISKNKLTLVQIFKYKIDHNANFYISFDNFLLSYKDMV